MRTASREDRLTPALPSLHGSVLERPALRWGFLSGVVALLLGAMALVYVGFVKVKMLPSTTRASSR